MGLKILQIGKYFSPDVGGIESTTKEIADGLNNEGIVCDVFCFGKTNKNTVEQFSAYKVYRAGITHRGKKIAIPTGYINFLKSILAGYDILHLHVPNPIAVLAIYYIKPRHKKLVVHWHSDIVVYKPLYTFFKPFENWILKQADIIAGTSEKYIQHSQPLKKYLNKCTAVPSAISDNDAAISKTEIEIIQEKYRHKKIIFSLGRFVAYKGFRYLIEAAQYLPDDCVVVIGGVGPLQKTLNQEIISLKLEHKVLLPGRIPDSELMAFFKACYTFVLPSCTRNEAFGLVLIEAMSFAKPLITFDIPGSGVSWVNCHNESGLVANEINAKCLAEKINILLKDANLTNRLGNGAFNRFKALFTADKEVSSFKNIYAQLMFEAKD